ncbi:MAG: hypothetical protein ABSD99_01745 [Candidatus Bathyarchaeia archaeon]
MRASPSLFLAFVVLVVLLPSGLGAVHGQMVFDVGKGWDSYIVYRPCILYNGSLFMMWYSGSDSNQIDGIGLATSKDGIAWTRYSGNPVMTRGQSGSWDFGGVNDQWVMFEGGGYKMWFTSRASPDASLWQIGYATSPDGIHWSKYSSNPVLTPNATSWDAKDVDMPTVIHNGSGYTMYYLGSSDKPGSVAFNPHVGIATSLDGVHWTKIGTERTVSIPFGNGWDGGSNWDYLTSVSFQNGSYVGFYSSMYDSHYYMSGPVQNAALNSQIGMATSSDGIHWIPNANNPIISYGSGSWDQNGIETPMTIIVGNQFYVYFTAQSSSARRIGLAILPATLPVPEFPTALLVLSTSMIAVLLCLQMRRKKPSCVTSSS